jgi:hypothetical protein
MQVRKESFYREWGNKNQENWRWGGAGQDGAGIGVEDWSYDRLLAHPEELI